MSQQSDDHAINEEIKKEFIIDNLSKKDEEKLQEIHAEDYIGTDDDMPDAFEAWLMDLSLSELKYHLGISE